MNGILSDAARWVRVIFCWVACGAGAWGQTKDFGVQLLDENLWKTPLADLEKTYLVNRSPEQLRMMALQREMLKRRGFDPGEIRDHAFVWLSAQHDGLLAEAGAVPLWGEKVGEIVIRGTEGNASTINVSLYNRGDDGTLKVAELQSRLEKWKKLLDEKTGVRGESRKSTSAVEVTAFQWRKGDTAILLESSVAVIEDQQRAEFLRIRLASFSGADGKIAGRTTLKGNVERKDDGDVYIKNMPMVDQGQKGYCAVASIARVASYYKLDVDQHEVAQLANTTRQGTSPEELELAFKTIISKLHIRTTQHYEFTQRQFEADVRAYNQLAKKEDKREFKAPKGYELIPEAVWMLMDPEIFAKVKGEQSGCKRYMTKIAEYIDQGIPLCWCLRLGMFPEKGIPQAGGGHMRLIIGYNDKTQEIIYTDSWGKGHEFKKMALAKAYACSISVYTMSPTR
jgi:hypothetical protein